MPFLDSDLALAKYNHETAGAELDKAGITNLINVDAQRVLDVGCGLGGKTVYYAERGAELVVGLDLDEKRARVAMELARRHPAGTKVRIVIGNGMHLPFCKDAFDQIISTDVIEHIDDPFLAIRDWARVIRSGGVITITAIPYYSPWGAHTRDWLPLPWIQVILPKRCLFRLINWVEQYRQINRHRPCSVRIDWTNFNDPAHARLLTVAQLESAINLVGIKVVLFKIVPAGERLGGIMARITRAIIHLPILREILSGIVVAVLQKPTLGLSNEDLCL